ncbi:MAG: helix-turn-helix transcriptional regulator [Muricomes sp.]
MDKIGENIKYLRQQRHWSQAQLAAKLHVTRQALSYYENGDRFPNLYVTCQLADIFDVTIDSLIGR